MDHDPAANGFDGSDPSGLLQRRLTFLLNSIEPAWSLDSAFQALLGHLLEFLPARFGSVWLFNGLDNTLVLREVAPYELDGVSLNLQSLPRRVLHISECLSGHTVRTGAPQLFIDSLSMPLNANAAFHSQHGLSTLMSFPILGLDGHVRGVVNAYQRADRTAEPADMDVAARAVRALSAKLDVAHLTVKRDLEGQLSAFSQRLLEGDMEARIGWDGLAQQIAHALEGEACSIFMKTSNDSIQLTGTTGMIGDPPYHSVVYPSGAGLTGRCFQLNNPIIYYRELSRDLVHFHKSIHRERLSTSERSESIVFVPIRDHDGAAIGVIRCNNKRYRRDKSVGRFTSEDMNLLGGIAAYIADAEIRAAWIRRREKDREAAITNTQHELIAPLQYVLNYVDSLTSLARFENAGDPAMFALLRVRLGKIAETVKRCAFMIRGVIDLDKGTIDHIEDLDLTSLAREVEEWLQDDARRRSVVTRVQSPAGARVAGDRFQLMRLLFNLLRNAIAYYDEAEAHRYGLLRLIPSETSMVIECEDNGIGIRSDETGSLFVLRARGEQAVKRRPDGLGIGLAACRAIAKAHGGRIELVNGRKPTLFRVAIPCARTQEPTT